jgi:hypothetical protein
MSITHDDVLRAALLLPEHERMLLAEELIESVPEPESSDSIAPLELLAVFSGVLEPAAPWGPIAGPGRDSILPAG